MTELVEGESLADRLRGGPLPPSGGARDRRAAVRARWRVPTAPGVVHRDVKPANVLLGDDGRVRVGDFGVARLAEGTTEAVAATVAGTPRYMSPEQARGRPTSAATDVYSVGVVLYEMLTGAPPFREGSVVELGLRHLQDPPPPLPETVPGELRAIVEKAMAKRPSARFADGGEMERALHAARGGASGAGQGSPERVRALAPRLPDTAAGATRPLDREALATRPLDRGSERTRVLGGAPPAPPAMGPRRRGGPSRRRALIALVVAVAAIGGLIAAVQLTSSAARTVVPELRTLPRGGVEARARRLHVRPVFSARHSETPDGIAIAQSPRPGRHVDQGSTVEVVLSSGPPPVAVPGVVGKAASTAETTIADAGLRYSLTRVPAPGRCRAPSCASHPPLRRALHAARPSGCRSPRRPSGGR